MITENALTCRFAENTMCIWGVLPTCTFANRYGRITKSGKKANFLNAPRKPTQMNNALTCGYVETSSDSPKRD